MIVDDIEAVSMREIFHAVTTRERARWGILTSSQVDKGGDQRLISVVSVFLRLDAYLMKR